MQSSSRQTEHDPPIVSFLERDISDLQNRYPELTRAEIVFTVSAVGPSRDAVERELRRLAGLKSPIV